MRPAPGAERGFNLPLFIVGLFALTIYLLAMLVVFPLRIFEKPDPLDRPMKDYSNSL
ncbi:MAG: hypothetical protein H6Q43_1659 [Deltaproteobacteria bacterium]|nr:hypothetical protein [Deltaproteobacteria bacterium]